MWGINMFSSITGSPALAALIAAILSPSVLIVLQRYVLTPRHCVEQQKLCGVELAEIKQAVAKVQTNGVVKDADVKDAVLKELQEYERKETIRPQMKELNRKLWYVQTRLDQYITSQGYKLEPIPPMPLGDLGNYNE